MIKVNVSGSEYVNVPADSIIIIIIIIIIAVTIIIISIIARTIAIQLSLFN
jgi:hypothetical protein